MSGCLLLNKYVRPWVCIFDNSILFSGIMGQHMATVVSFEKARERLLVAMIADTVLTGHRLERDLVVLWLLHSHVVDTVLLFKVMQHRYSQVALGLPAQQSRRFFFPIL